MGQGKDDKWEMPKPIFRSTTGSLPKSFEETISQSFSPDTDTVEIDEDDDILGVMDASIVGPAKAVVDTPAEQVDLASQPAPENVVRAKAESTPPKREKPSTAIIFLVIAALAAAIAVAYYFLNRAL